MREVLLLHHECFQACVCQSQFSGVCQDVLSGAGGLHHFADAGQSDWRREQFLPAQAQNGSTQIMWVTAVMLLHFVFSVFSVSSGLPGGSFIPTLVTGGLLGQIVGLVGVRYGVIGQENVSYIMLVSMSAFLVAVVRTLLMAIVLITEITGHFEVFYPSVVVGGLTYYFTELLQMKPSNVSLYEDMIHAPDFKEEKRYTLSVEIMTDSYLDGKTGGRTVPAGALRHYQCTSGWKIWSPQELV